MLVLCALDIFLRQLELHTNLVANKYQNIKCINAWLDVTHSVDFTFNENVVSRASIKIVCDTVLFEIYCGNMEHNE